MKRVLILLVFCHCNGLLAQEIVSIESKLIDSSGKPIPYASIINITTNNHGTTSNKNGDFLLKTRQSYQDEIQINALGFYELSVTLADFAKLAKAEAITLKEKPIDLGEIEVNGERYEQDYIGKSTQLLKTTDNVLYSDPIGEKPGHSEGVYVQPKKKTSALMDKIHFYVTEDGSLNKPLSIRLLRSKDKLKNNQGYKLDEFDDMIDSLLIIKDVKVGWNTFDLYDFDIHVDSRPFFILFTSLETLEAAKLRDAGETVESVNFAAFADRTAKEIYKALSFDGIILYLANAQVKTPIPAVYVEYSKLKK